MNKIKLLLLAAIIGCGLTAQAQSISQDIGATVSDTLHGPWIGGAGYERGLDNHVNLAALYIGYNFITPTNGGTGFSAGLIGGVEELWASGQKPQEQTFNGGFQIGETFKPFQAIGLGWGTNITTTVAAYQLVASAKNSDSPIGSITGMSVTADIYQWKGFNLMAQGVLSTRSGQGFLNGKYLGGFLAIGHALPEPIKN